MKWFIKALKQYADFKGRSRRTEYWMFSLFTLIIGVILTLIEIMTGTFNYFVNMGPLSALFGLVIFLPSISVNIRRLHDVGKSGWLILLPSILLFGTILVFGLIDEWIDLFLLVPFAGSIWYFILMIRDSQPGANEYGENPKNVPYVEKEQSDLFYVLVMSFLTALVMSFLTALFIAFGIYALIDITGIISSLESAEQIKNILLVVTFIIAFGAFLSFSYNDNSKTNKVN